MYPRNDNIGYYHYEKDQHMSIDEKVYLGWYSIVWFDQMRVQSWGGAPLSRSRLSRSTLSITTKQDRVRCNPDLGQAGGVCSDPIRQAAGVGTYLRSHISNSSGPCPCAPAQEQRHQWHWQRCQSRRPSRPGRDLTFTSSSICYVWCVHYNFAAT